MVLASLPELVPVLCYDNCVHGYIIGPSVARGFINKIMQSSRAKCVPTISPLSSANFTNRQLELT